MSKNKLIDWLIILFVYLAFGFFPYDEIIKNTVFWSSFARLIGIFISFIIILFLAKKKSSIQIKDREKCLTKTFYFLPSLVICGSNFFYFIFNPKSYCFSYDNNFIILLGVQTLTAIIEEYIFRGLLHDILEIDNTLLRIVVVSFIFAIFHFAIFLTTFNPVDLIIPLYTFGLGIVLGLVYEYSGCLLASIVFHVLFNIINFTLFSYSVETVKLWSFIIINVVISAIYIVYLFLIYKIVLEKKVITVKLDGK